MKRDLIDEVTDMSDLPTWAQAIVLVADALIVISALVYML